MVSSVNNAFSQGTLFIILPDKADDHLTGPEEEGEDVQKGISKVTVEITVVRWDGISHQYNVKCVKTNIDNTVDSNNSHELIDKSFEGPMKNLYIFIHSIQQQKKCVG